MIVIRSLLAVIRLILFSSVSLTIFSFLFFSNLFYNSTEKKLERGILYRRIIIRIIHYILSSKITVCGIEPVVSGLIISNHRSYFDAIVILRNILAYPIAKTDVASWPLVGTICKSTGVIFVDRENNACREETLKEISSVLKNGFSILNTPEGTTHIEPTTIPFKPGAFVLAAQLGKPVIPIAIDYRDLKDAWIGNDTFIPHFLRCFGKWRTEIKISYLDPVGSDSVDELISVSKKQIDQELIRFRKDWNSNN